MKSLIGCPLLEIDRGTFFIRQGLLADGIGGGGGGGGALGLVIGFFATNSDCSFIPSYNIKRNFKFSSWFSSKIAFKLIIKCVELFK